MITTFIKHDVFIIRWEGKIKTYDEFVEFKNKLKDALQSYKNSPESSYPLTIALIDTFPCNTYALGYLLKIKKRDNYIFRISTNNHKLFTLFENIEFDKIFDILIERDPQGVK